MGNLTTRTSSASNKLSSVTLRIVTDSTSDLEPEFAMAHGVTVVPLSILFGDEQFLDRVDMTSEQFFARLSSGTVLPTTSQSTPAAFRETYKRLIATGATEILSLHLPASLSGTYASARQAAEGLDAHIEIVDSGVISLVLGLGAVSAAEMAAEGAGIDEVHTRIKDQFSRSRLFVALETLEYLRRGGRIGRAAEMVGSALKLKPIITIEGGGVVPVGRVRTHSKAIENLIDRAAALRPIEQIVVIHATTPDDLDYVVGRLRGLAPDASLVTGTLGPVLGVHTGPGTIGVITVSSATASASTPG